MTHKEFTQSSERGAALFVALALIVIMTFLGFGLLSRAFLSSRIAGLERWPTKTFYAADSGIAAARARLKVRQTAGFNFQVPDYRGPTAQPAGQPINIQVSPLAQMGAPRPAKGFQVGGGQGGGTQALYITLYQGVSTAVHTTTKSRRVIKATMSFGPAPLSMPGN